jgi:Arabinofuranosyltransferase N terminal/Arabinofuranosyltransferase A C terminal
MFTNERSTREMTPPVPAQDQVNGPSDTPADTPTPRSSLAERWRLTGPAFAACLTALVAVPVAFVGARVPEFPGGGEGLRSLGIPVVGGILAGLVIWLFAHRRPVAWLAGVAAGGLSAWVVLSLSTALRGTPFPFYGLIGDSGRIVAMATRYSVTPASSDMMIPGLPSEYPPLFPWVVGRAAALLNVDAWRIVGDFEILFTGFAVLAGFLLWQRLLPAWPALVTTAFAFMAFAVPVKAYETLALVVFLPWALLTFGNPPRGRLHWLVSGVVAGLLVLAYYGWLVFGSLALLALGWRTLRAEENRRAFLLYLAKVVVVAFAVSSWYLVPLAHAKLTLGGAMVADLHGNPGMFSRMFPFLEITSPGVAGFLAIAQLIGLLGLIFLRGKTWWATPLLIIVVGAYAYQLITAVYFIFTSHSMLSHYAPTIALAALSVAAPLTVAHVGPRMLSRFSVEIPKVAVSGAVAVSVMFAGYSFCIDWMAGTGGRFSDYTRRAFLEPYPDGTRLETGENQTPWFPVTPIQNAVERVLGTDHDAVVLSADERLFAYLPWYGYIGNDLWVSIAHTLERYAEVERVSRIHHPAELTEQTKRTRFGPIDVFVLKNTTDGWQCVFHRGYGVVPLVVSFQRAQFDERDWEIVQVPEDYVVVIRKAP